MLLWVTSACASAAHGAASAAANNIPLMRFMCSSLYANALDRNLRLNAILGGKHDFKRGLSMIRIPQRFSAAVLLAALIPAARAAVVLENDYVRVSRDEAPCAQAGTPGCTERVIVAMGDVQLRIGKVLRGMRRGEVAVFKADESYQAPSGGPFYE